MELAEQVAVDPPHGPIRDGIVSVNGVDAQLSLTRGVRNVFNVGKSGVERAVELDGRPHLAHGQLNGETREPQSA
eukprot:11197253-Lingulodinium_polyedra.AAC.1